jgi:hypothetical protein
MKLNITNGLGLEASFKHGNGPSGSIQAAVLMSNEYLLEGYRFLGCDTV